MSEPQSQQSSAGVFLAIILLIIVAAGVGGYFVWDSMDELGRKNRELERQSNSLRASNAELENKLRDAESDRSQLRSDNADLERKSAQTAKDLAAAKQALDKAKSEAAKTPPAQNSCADLEKKAASLAAEKSGLEAKLAEALAAKDQSAPKDEAQPAPAAEKAAAQPGPDARVAGPDPRLAELENGLAACRQDLDAAKGKSAEQAERLKSSYDALVKGLKQETQKQEIAIRRFKERLELTMLDSLLFSFASSRITPAGRKVLETVAKELARMPDRRVYVVGHTDDAAVRWDASGSYHDNWQLSADRASAVVSCLTDDFGLDPARFTVAGRSFYQPAAPNDSKENKARNRRVEIIIGDVDL